MASTPDALNDITRRIILPPHKLGKFVQDDEDFFQSMVAKKSNSNYSEVGWSEVLKTKNIRVMKCKPPGASVTAIRGFSLMEGCVPDVFFAHLSTPALMKQWMNNVIDTKSFEPLDEYNDVTYNTYRYPGLLSNRDACNNRCRKIDKANGKYIMMWRSCVHPDYPEVPDFIRTWTFGCYIVEAHPTDPNTSMFYSFGMIDAKGWLPDWFVTQFCPQGIVDLCTKVSKCCVAYQLEQAKAVRRSQLTLANAAEKIELIRKNSGAEQTEQRARLPQSAAAEEEEEEEDDEEYYDDEYYEEGDDDDDDDEEEDDDDDQQQQGGVDRISGGAARGAAAAALPKPPGQADSWAYGNHALSPPSSPLPLPLQQQQQQPFYASSLSPPPQEKVRNGDKIRGFVINHIMGVESDFRQEEEAPRRRKGLKAGVKALDAKLKAGINRIKDKARGARAARKKKNRGDEEGEISPPPNRHMERAGSMYYDTDEELNGLYLDPDLKIDPFTQLEKDAVAGRESKGLSAKLRQLKEKHMRKTNSPGGKGADAAIPTAVSPILSSNKPQHGKFHDKIKEAFHKFHLDRSPYRERHADESGAESSDGGGSPPRRSSLSGFLRRASKQPAPAVDSPDYGNSDKDKDNKSPSKVTKSNIHKERVAKFLEGAKKKLSKGKKAGRAPFGEDGPTNGGESPEPVRRNSRDDLELQAHSKPPSKKSNKEKIKGKIKGIFQKKNEKPRDSSAITELEKLIAMKELGHLTADEFQALKHKIIY